MWTQEVRIMELKEKILYWSLAFGHGLECNLLFGKVGKGLALN